MIEQTVLVAMVIGLVEAIKKTNKINEAYLPLTTIVIGAIVKILDGGVTVENAVSGIVIGLIAAGTYDVVKNPARVTYGLIKK